MTKKVLVAGGINFDIIAPVDRMPIEHEKLRCDEYFITVGGSASNTAKRIVKCGLPAHLLSTIGADAFGDTCLQSLAEAGVDVTRVTRTSDRPTGLAIVFSSKDSKRMITFAGPSRDGSYDAMGENDFIEFAHLHITGEPSDAIARLVDRFAGSGRTVSIEWNGRDMSLLGCKSQLNFMNFDELRRIRPNSSDAPDHAAATLANELGQSILVTLGEKGALWATSDGDITWQATTPVDPVDRTGGGDAFDAGVIVAFLQGADKASCLRAGLDAAIIAITTKGG